MQGCFDFHRSENLGDNFYYAEALGAKSANVYYDPQGIFHFYIDHVAWNDDYIYCRTPYETSIDVPTDSVRTGLYSNNGSFKKRKYIKHYYIVNRKLYKSNPVQMASPGVEGPYNEVDFKEAMKKLPSPTDSAEIK